jgi:hypothetical protein
MSGLSVCLHCLAGVLPGLIVPAGVEVEVG